MCRLTEKQSYEVPLGLSGGPQLHKQENSIRAASTNEAEDNDEDPYDKMVTFLTGRTKSERTSKERAIIFPVKVSSFVAMNRRMLGMLMTSLLQIYSLLLYPCSSCMSLNVGNTIILWVGN